MRLRPFKFVLRVSVLAFVATLLSSYVHGTVRLRYPGTIDCSEGCDFVAGGWPFMYLIDSHGLSPAGSVSLLDGLMGLDIVDAQSTAATFLFWLVVFALSMWLGRVWRSALAVRGQPKT
jgi:hypothetical protein